jgi:50S ribosomal subunit-associated GTPase HflX
MLIVKKVDCSDKERLEEAGCKLRTLLDEEDLKSLPFLVFLNKQDVCAMTEWEAALNLNLVCIWKLVRESVLHLMLCLRRKVGKDVASIVGKMSWNSRHEFCWRKKEYLNELSWSEFCARIAIPPQVMLQPCSFVNKSGINEGFARLAKKMAK